MSALDFTTTTLGDLCKEALFESGVVGRGMTPGAEDLTRAWTRLQWIAQQWERKRWMLFGVQAVVAQVTGKTSYTVGDQGADFSISSSGQDNNRPSRIEAAFFRIPSQIGAQGALPPVNANDFSPDFSSDFGPLVGGGGAAGVGGFLDYPLTQIESGEDYWSRVRLKGLVSWPQFFYYEATWPLGNLYVYPQIPAAVGYQLGIVVRQILPTRLAKANSLISVPPEYHSALTLETAVALRSAYQYPSFPGDSLPQRRADAIKTLRTTNFRMGRLTLTPELLGRGGQYNIFADRST